ncbi:MAG: hypothetical protein R3362_08720 [Rhodothermales bacterium]|nr:hypothetical protein [Rhodothermales bacterium]
MAVDGPADAQRLGRAGIEDWLTTLALSNEAAAAFARDALGPVLAQDYVVGFVLEDANPAACATVRDVLYVPVPPRFQGPERRFDGLVVRDACDLSPEGLCRFCTGGYGETDDGAACSCVCTIGECPGVECVAC